MNRFELNEKLKEAILKTVASSIDSSDIYSSLYSEFYDSCNAIAERIKKENELIIDTFKGIVQAFGVDIPNFHDIEKSVEILKKEIVKRAATDKPKQRYFTYGYLGEYSHKYLVVTSKDFKYVEELDYIYEDVCYSFYFREDHKIVNAMVDKLKCDIDELLGLSDDDLMNKVQEFFKVIITDDTISREEFSEYLECCLRKAEGAGRGLTTEWIAI